MGLQLFAGPAAEPITLEVAKYQVSVFETETDHDEALTAWIVASRLKVEQDTGHKLATQTWDVSFDAFPVSRGSLVLPIGPLQSVVSVTAYDDTDVGGVVSAALYAVDAFSVRGRIALRRGQAWPTTTLRPVNGVIVRGVFGYGAAASVSAAAAPLLAAQRLLIGHWFANREAVGPVMNDVPLGYAALIAPYVLGRLA